ncbi:MAG TPA: molybdenum ABC transporter ATP-binding protein [Devosia sp.]|nr:molybdenum ABC transporter ATP-binding protein [Devosia sp.]
MSGLSAALRGRRGGFAIEAAIEAPARAVTALFGPSGAGKTSLMRAIAGLDRLEGHCVLDGDIWQDEAHFMPVEKRGVGYVFQEASLFPHLNVRQNLEYGLRRAGPVRVIGLDDAVSLLGLAGLMDRSPLYLSGGERQRVALGRALLSQPRLLLLDEPLSGLDGAAKEEILPYFEALGQRLGLPVLLVTHDMAEVERLADRMVLLRDGKVVAAGPLNRLLTGAGIGLRGGREAAAVLLGHVAGYDTADGLSTIAVEGLRMLVAGRAGPEGGAIRIRIAARDVSLALSPPRNSSILNVLPALVESIEPVGDAEAVALLRLGEQSLLARLTRRSVRELGLLPGLSVFAQVKGVSLLTGPGEAERD